MDLTVLTPSLAGLVGVLVGAGISSWTQRSTHKDRLAADRELAERKITADIALAERKLNADIALAEKKLSLDRAFVLAGVGLHLMVTLRDRMLGSRRPVSPSVLSASSEPNSISPKPMSDRSKPSDFSSPSSSRSISGSQPAFRASLLSVSLYA
jgi:hypothetical protein